MNQSTWNISKAPSQKGKIAIVTGANAGLGYETALALAQKEAKVIMACRNMSKAEKAKAAILKEVPNGDLEIMEIDLSKLKSVRNFVTAFLSKYDALHLLINNAGVMMGDYGHEPKDAALPTLIAAIGTEVKGGQYYGPTGNKEETKGPPGLARSKSKARDEEMGKRLWAVSEELTGVKIL